MQVSVVSDLIFDFDILFELLSKHFSLLDIALSKRTRWLVFCHFVLFRKSYENEKKTRRVVFFCFNLDYRI